MRKLTIRIALVLAITCMLFACSLPYARPDSGRFYCEELEMTLDFSTYQATFIEAGVEITKTFCLDYGQQLSISGFDENGYYQPVLCGDFKYRNEKVIVDNYNDNTIYIFLLME